MAGNRDGLYRLLRRRLNVDSFIFRVCLGLPRASPRHTDLLKEVSFEFSSFGHQAETGRAARRSQSVSRPT
eukprot:4844923-Karenia_brevis.AAC.1